MGIKCHFEICNNSYASWKYLQFLLETVSATAAHIRNGKRVKKDATFFTIHVHRPTGLKPRIYKELCLLNVLALLSTEFNSNNNVLLPI